MADPKPLTQDEYDSIEASVQEIGEHLESIGQTDMSKMTYDQFCDHIRFAYTKVCEKNRAKWAGPDGVPF